MSSAICNWLSPKIELEFEFEAEPTAWVAAVPYPFGYTPRKIGNWEPPIIRAGQWLRTRVLESKTDRQTGNKHIWF